MPGVEGEPVRAVETESIALTDRLKKLGVIDEKTITFLEICQDLAAMEDPKNATAVGAFLHRVMEGQEYHSERIGGF